MIRLIDKSHFFSVERIWFMKPKEIINSDCDIIRYYRFRDGEFEHKSSIKNVDYTLITNLKDSEEQILSKINRTFRYHINRCSTDNVIINNYSSCEIKSNFNLIEDFKKTYMHFCDLCNNQQLKKVYREANIQTYIENDCIMLSCGDYGCGKVYHLYVWDKSNALLIHSASDFRNDNIDKALAGRANKFLHYRDMLYFKEKNVSSYDWGNVTSFDKPNGIDKFKMSFGGQQVIVNSYFVGNSILGNILVVIKKIKDWLINIIRHEK